MRKFLCALGLFSIFILLLAPLGMAQSLTSGDISGTVSDPSGAVIKDAIVNVKSLDTGATQTTATSDTGLYRFSLLRPGRYSVKVTQEGFQGAERQVTVAIGQVASANFALQVGKATEIVEVTGTLPVVNVESAAISTAFDQRAVADLPNPGGDLSNIAQLAPGVTMNTSSGYGNFTANGMPATSNLFTVNGENNMDPYFNINNTGATNLSLGLNEIQEATIVTNAYGGQYGQLAGAQVNYITKAGTNGFHGSAKYLWNGRIMNANDWFANNQGSSRPFANNNQWGADFGGPIQKDKTFFYVNTEGIRYVLPTVQNTYIPTPQLTSAVLANVATTQPNSLPLYQKLFDLWGKPNTPGAQNATPVAGSCGDLIGRFGFTDNSACALNFSATPNAMSHEWIISGRLDHNFSDNDKVFFRFRRDNGVQPTYTDPVQSAFNASSVQPSYDGQTQWTHIFNNNMTNQFIAAGTYYSAIFKQDQAKVNALFPYTIYWQSEIFNQIANPTYLPGSIFDTYGFPQGRNVAQYQVIDDLSVVRGNHTLKFGGNFARYNMSDYTASGMYTHPRVYFTSLSDFADGVAYRFVKRFPTRESFPVATYNLGMYAQDEWKVKNNLKLTFALRAEHNSNPVCQADCFSLFAKPIQQLNIGPDVAYNQMIEAGRHQIYRKTDALNLGPRFGFVWSPLGNEKTVISGGFGIFYNSLAAGVMYDDFTNFPNIVNSNVYSTDTAGLWADPTAAGSAYIASVSANAIASGFANGASYNSLLASTGGLFRPPSFMNFATTMHTPRYQEWSLQVQRALGADMSFTLAYAGMHGIHIPIANSFNAWDPYGQGAGFPSTIPYPNFAGVTQYSTSAVANSNNLTATLQRRFSHGVSFQANYTWGHALDEISNGGIDPYGADSLAGQLNPASLRANNYGNADYDIRHNFSGNFVWEPPHKFGNKIVNGLLGGWNFSGTIFARSGLPYSVLDNNTFFPNYWTGVIPGQPLGPGATYGAASSCNNPDKACFDPNAFVDTYNTLPLASYPTQRRNQYRGPGFFNTNFSPSKGFNLTERMKLRVGANFYNLFNNVNFYLPNAYLSTGDPGVGHIQSTVSVPASPYGSFVGAAASGRMIQLQARITF
jgi:carboxypeptidase family protein